VKAVKISTTTATSKKRMKAVMIEPRGDGHPGGKQDRRHRVAPRPIA
jgi:hypothetical protein